ncbi:hypothetical protein GCM10007332_07110 [Epilithonimonas arachidiradicis]|nr:hypothetical protein GCM10007332_07110 [Epilithonimonas arachidiradicis]
MSFATDIDMSQALEMMQSFMPDSLNQNADFMKMDKYPRTWQNLYDIQKAEGKAPTNQDSIKLMKKIFFKGNFDADKFKGFSVKSDPLTNEELSGVGAVMGKEASVMNNNAFDDWNGKALKIDMSKLQMSPADLEALLKGGETDGQTTKEDLDGILSMMDMDLKNKLVFDKKIKSVTGKHDWIKKVDNNTIEVNFSLKELMDKEHQFKDKDQLIVIETE